MKKTLRTLIAVILASVIAMGSMSAFAANETITLDFYDDKYEYIYGGNLTEGKNNVDISGEDLYFYYEFEAGKDGYYIVETVTEGIWWIAAAEKNTAGRYDEENLLDYTAADYSEGDTEKYLYYLEKGTYIIFADKNEEGTETTTFGIEYAGAEITAFDFEGGVKYNLVPDLDIFCELDEDGYYNVFRPGKTTISFDSSKTYDVEFWFMMFESESEITEGENKITVEFAGKTFEKTILVQGIEHNIKSIEVKNFDEFDTVKAYYDGCLDDYDVDFIGLELVVEFSNGEKETLIESYEKDAVIMLPNGNPTTIYPDYGYGTDENGNAYFYVNVHGKEYVNLPVEKIEASAFENIEHLSEENTFVIDEQNSELLWNFIDVLLNVDTDEFFSSLKYFLEDFFTLVPAIANGIFGNFKQFIAA